MASSKRCHSPFWRAFWITPGILTVLQYAGLWKALRDELDPQWPLEIDPA